MRWFGLGQAGSTSQPNTFSRKAILAGAASLALVAGGAAGDAVVRGLTSSHAAVVSTSPPSGGVAGAPVSFADIAERVRPAVVSVQVTLRNAQFDGQAPDLGLNGPFDDFFRRFGFPDQIPAAPQAEAQAQGSGFFVSPDGFIVTNNHVVENADRVSVTLDDGHSVDARVVATDPRTDLALLKTDTGRDYPYVRFAAAQPRIGDWVLAVGNPFGLGGTVTAGIVSARGRDIGEGPYDDFLQIDAPVNRGNSGGPTFNLNGEVVGVNTAIYSPSGGNVGIAFAIPASTAQPVVDALEHGRDIERGYLGVMVQPLDQDIARSLGLHDQHGALVAQVNAGSPAARAGLRSGDVILRAGDATIDDSRDLARAVAAHRPGSRLSIEYLRGGRRQSVTATLAAMQTEEHGADKGKAQEGQPQADAGSRLGLSLAPTATGLEVTGVDPAGAAAAHGLAPGDVILDAGGAPCRTVAALDAAIARARRNHRDAVLLHVQERDGVRYVGLPLDEG